MNKEELKNVFINNPKIKVSVSEVISLIDQLDEPESLSQEWINEHAKAVTYDGIPDQTEVVYVDELQSVLVPKQDKPVIPKFVADYIERMKKCQWANITDLIGMADDELEDWWFGEERFCSVARAWLDGYTVEEEQKHKRFKVVDTNSFQMLGKYVEDQKEVQWISEGALNHLDFDYEFTEQEINGIDPRYMAFAKKVDAE